MCFHFVPLQYFSRYDNGYDMTAADLTKRYADLQQVSRFFFQKAAWVHSQLSHRFTPSTREGALPP
jgi:hypothetical protein